MKTVVLFGMTLLASAPSFAQTGTSAPGDPASKIITMTGCVGSGPATKAITLSDAMIIPGTPQPGHIDQTPSPLPPPVSADATEPPAGSAPVPSPTGTSGSKTPAPSASGSSTAAGTTAGTTGVVTGTAPAGSSGSSLTGYRLSGADMTPWIGQRVQVVGTFVPAAATAAAPVTAPSTATSAPAQTPTLEFNVQTVRAATGPCPK